MAKNNKTMPKGLKIHPYIIRIVLKIFKKELDKI